MARAKHDLSKVKVININKNGEIFDPKTYTVPYEGNEHIYAWIEDYARRNATNG